LKDPIVPGDGWDKIVSKFTLRDGEVLLIQYNEGHEPPPGVVENLSQQIKGMEVNATVLLIPAELRAEHIPLAKVGDLLDVIIELAENALGEGRTNGKPDKRAGRSNSGAEGKCGMAQRGGQSVDDGSQGTDAAQS